MIINCPVVSISRRLLKRFKYSQLECTLCTEMMSDDWQYSSEKNFNLAFTVLKLLWWPIDICIFFKGQPYYTVMSNICFDENWRSFVLGFWRTLKLDRIPFFHHYSLLLIETNRFEIFCAHLPWCFLFISFFCLNNALRN